MTPGRTAKADLTAIDHQVEQVGGLGRDLVRGRGPFQSTVCLLVGFGSGFLHQGMATVMAKERESNQASDAALLHAFVVTGSEEAFAALVEKHLGMVLGIAVRKTGDHGLPRLKLTSNGYDTGPLTCANDKSPWSRVQSNCAACHAR